MKTEIEIRPARTEDTEFVFATWLRSYRHASQFAKKISNEVYYRWHHKVIERILARGAQVYIAHPIGEPEVILGYICLESQDKLVVHYIYVKKAFRKMGVAKMLYTPEIGDVFTHWTADMDWATKKWPELTYDPYRI